jgi:hypothetical protein
MSPYYSSQYSKAISYTKERDKRAQAQDCLFPAQGHTALQRARLLRFLHFLRSSPNAYVWTTITNKRCRYTARQQINITTGLGSSSFIINRHRLERRRDFGLPSIIFNNAGPCGSSRDPDCKWKCLPQSLGWYIGGDFNRFAGEWTGNRNDDGSR